MQRVWLNKSLSPHTVEEASQYQAQLSKGIIPEPMKALVKQRCVMELSIG